MISSAPGFTPIEIKTAEGQREYADTQRALVEPAARMPQQLIGEAERLISPHSGLSPGG